MPTPTSTTNPPRVHPGLTRDFTVGGTRLGDATAATTTSNVGGAGSTQRRDPIAERSAPRAFQNIGDLINFMKSQTIRDVMQAIGIGTTKQGEEAKLDGKLLGGGKTVHTLDPTNPSQWRDIDGIKPKAGAPTGKILEVNGINTDADIQRSNIQYLADKTGKEVVGIHNASGGLIEDAFQFLNDKYIRCNNPAVNTVRDAVLDSVKKGERIDLVAHSQGGIITARALQEAQLELRDDLKAGTFKSIVGDNWEAIEKKPNPTNHERRLLHMAKETLKAQVENMFSNVHVSTFGGAARIWPDGPKYVHTVNKNDPVPALFGVTFPFAAHPGKAAVIHFISENHPTDKHGADAIDASVHGPEQVYFKHALSYEEAVAKAASGDRDWKQI